MYRFILQLGLFIILTVSSFFLILSFAGGYTDAFYVRFTSPTQRNLILGTSRAAQGIQPTVLNEIIPNKSFFNYAFTATQSPFGPVYLKSIQKKIDSTTKNGIFIVTVDPWSISSKSKDPNDSSKFRENNLALATVSNVNRSPNYEYLLEHLGGNYHKILFPLNTKSYLHKDGWLEISLNMDSSIVQKRTTKRLTAYEDDVLPTHKFSTFRLAYLNKTIQYLKKFGKVYLVRLPVSTKMFNLETFYMNDFDSRIAKAINTSDGYLDMTPLNANYTFTDGNHLHKKSGKIVSMEIAQWILSLQ